MKTVQMTLDDELVDEVDALVKQLHTSRSAFTRDALREAIAAYERQQQELKHRKGYEKFPADREEFAVWESEQAWGDE